MESRAGFEWFVRRFGCQYRGMDYPNQDILCRGVVTRKYEEDGRALVDLDVATARLVRLVREFRPHVLTTYDEQGGYPHPDHIRTHEVSMAAVEGFFPQVYGGRLIVIGADNDDRRRIIDRTAIGRFARPGEQLVEIDNRDDPSAYAGSA